MTKGLANNCDNQFMRINALKFGGLTLEGPKEIQSTPRSWGVKPSNFATFLHMIFATF